MFNHPETQYRLDLQYQESQRQKASKTALIHHLQENKRPLAIRSITWIGRLLNFLFL